MRWDWILPEPVSNLGAEIDSIYYLILIITGIIFVVVEVALVWFLIRYRHREGRRAAYSHGNKTAEIVWTVVPFVLVLFIAYTSNGVWLKAKLADREGGAPAEAAAQTTAGGIIGTYRAMSPEQANGLDLDPRSDLFSLAGCSTGWPSADHRFRWGELSRP